VNVTKLEETEDEIGLVIELGDILHAIETRCRQNAQHYQMRNNLENVLTAQETLGKLKRICQKRWRREAGGR
jgi:hypothetical protein